MLTFKRILALVLALGLTISPVQAYDPKARQIKTNTASFNGVLSSADTDVQKALETIDGMDAMVYPSAGLAKSTGSAWDTSVTDNSSDWDTAYGWGDHSGAGYLTAETDPLSLHLIQTSNTQSITATDATVTATDEFYFGDATDAGKFKKDTVQGILDLVPAVTRDSLGIDTNDDVAFGDIYANGDLIKFNVSGTDGWIGYAAGGTTYAGLWLRQATPSFSNYDFLSDGTNTFINAASSLYFRIGNATKLRMGTNGIGIMAATALHPFSVQRAYDGTMDFHVESDGGIFFDQFTSGSVPFIGASGEMLQDNSTLFWDNTNKRLGLGTTAPDAPLEVNGVIMSRVAGTPEATQGIQMYTAQDEVGGANFTAGYVDLWGSGRRLFFGSASKPLYSIDFKNVPRLDNVPTLVISPATRGPVSISTLASKTGNNLAIIANAGYGTISGETANTGSVGHRGFSFKTYSDDTDVYKIDSQYIFDSAYAAATWTAGNKHTSWKIAGVTKMVLDASGNLGIGTAAPSQALDLASGNLVTLGTGTFGTISDGALSINSGTLTWTSSSISDGTFNGSFYLMSGALGINTAPGGYYGLEVDSGSYTSGAASFIDTFSMRTIYIGNGYDLTDMSNWYIDGQNGAYFSDSAGGNSVYITDNTNAISSYGNVIMAGLSSGAGAPATILTNNNLYVDTTTGIVYVD